MTRISLERIAAKLQWLRAQGTAEADAYVSAPGYAEALCFLQAVSMRPGGLERFCATLLESEPDWRTVKSWKNYEITESESGWCERVFARVELDEFTDMVRVWCEDKNADDIGDPTFRRFDADFPRFLARVIEKTALYAKSELERTADTNLRRKVICELDFARTSRPRFPMVFVADTRHGKTTAINTYCSAWPGRARLVTIPESNSERDLYCAYAEAFGIEFTPSTKREELKSRVQYVLRETGIFCVHDEAHFLIPTKYDRDTPPQRLNWVRAQIIDRGLPCAFFCTPQSQEETLARYVKKTHHNMEQWLGRMPAPIVVDKNPSYEDLLAVARRGFPEFSEAVIEELCDGADQQIGCTSVGRGAIGRTNGEGGFKIIELGGARARFLAQQRGISVDVALVKEALTWAGVAEPDRKLAGKAPSTGGAAQAMPHRRGTSAAGPRVASLERFSVGETEPISAPA